MARFTQLFIATVLFAILTSVRGAEEEAVVTLSQSTFDGFIAKNEIALVEFYAPWCGHCKKLAPEYEAAAKHLKEKKSPVVLAKVDATKESELASKYNVAGYPTLKLFRKGAAEEYKGGRTKDGIIQWLKKQTAPAVSVISKASEADDIAKEDGVCFFGSFKDKDAANYKIFEKVADRSRDLGTFVAVFESDAKDTVTVVRREEGHAASESITTEEALEKFCQREMLPYFGPISGENYAAYFGSNAELVWFAGTKADYEKAGKPIREVAKEKGIAGVFRFVWLDIDQFATHAENALAIKDFPGLVLQTKAGRYVYPSKDFAKSEAIKRFLEDAIAGKIEKLLKSEPIPEKNDEPVKVIVGKTFEETVVQKDKDVLLEIYAPWCGHCKKLEPIYKEFAAAMKEVSHLVVAKMDGTANESPMESFTYNGFPTIFFVKAGTNKPISFDGARTAAGLLEFVKKHSTKPIEVNLKDEL